MIETLFAVLSSAAGGGILGLAGTAFKTWQERKDRESQRDHDLKMRELDQADMRLEAELLLKQTATETQGQLALAQTEADAERDVAAAHLQAASYKQDKATYSKVDKLSGWWGAFWQGMLALVDMVRGFMRPAITLYLLVICSVIAWELYDLVEAMETLLPTQAWPLFQQVVNAIIFLCTTSVTWWFGSRPNQQRAAT